MPKTIQHIAWHTLDGQPQGVWFVIKEGKKYGGALEEGNIIDVASCHAGWENKVPPEFDVRPYYATPEDEEPVFYRLMYK